MAKKVYFKKYDTDKGSVIAMCDSDLVGKIYKESSTVLDLKKYSNFYLGDLLHCEEASSLFTEDEIYTANVVGEQSVGLFIRKGIVTKETVRTVQGIPFVHVYKMV